jgi:hypothetical protein
LTNLPLSSPPLSEWFKALILKFRAEYSKLPPNTNKGQFNLFDFSAPCQLIVLWYGNNERQYAFLTRDLEREDLDIIAVGPLGDEDMEKAMSQILKIPRLVTARLDPEDASLHDATSYAEVLREYFLRIARAAPHFATLPKREGEPIIGMQRAFVFSGFDWLILGNLTNKGPQRVAQELIAQGSAQPPVSHGEETSQIIEETYVEGYAGHFRPRLWLGKKPARSFEERLASDTYNEWHFFTGHYKKHLVRLEERSSIFVECKDASEGLRLLNEIAGGLLLSNIPSFTFRMGMLSQARFRTKKVGPNQYAGFGGGAMTIDEGRYFGHLGIDEELLKGYREVPKELFLSILDRTEKTVDEAGKSDHLTTLVESFTHLSTADYKSTITMAWTIIESYCKTQHFLATAKDYSKAYRLAKRSRVSPESAFRALDRRHFFSEPKARFFLKLYDIRSKVVHGRMYTPTKAEAVLFFREAEMIVRKELVF